ncbi:MAG: 50S ribosome-binding GTPase [Planctomycetes bacterium]|nr:50S ribosome-binding GTPase [Planctomycetota bacterium]
MSRWQLILFLILVLLPIVLFGAVGAWALWNQGHMTWLVWVLPVSWTLAWILARNSKRVEFPLPEIGSHDHWTPQDHAALKIVETEQTRLEGITRDQLLDVAFFRDRTVDLATKLALHYHPRAKDPLDKLSVVEILTVAQLVSEDLEEWFQKNVPGSHLITVGQWRMLTQAPGWWNAATNVGWIASVAMNPVAGLGRYALSRAFGDPIAKQLQTGLLGMFFTVYMRQVGYYLIELNSGRLRGGSSRYRRAMLQLEGTVNANAAAAAPLPVEPVTVTIAIIGQVKAGKSSLVNCLLNNQQAAVDVLPLTKDVDRYELRLEESRDRLVLLDTPGYSDAGATREQIEATREAARQADLILLVMAATSPAKQADAKMLQELTSWFAGQRRLKPPPFIGVASKIDGLRPVMEWAPPYDWEHPGRPKEQSIRDAVDFAREATGNRLQVVVPVCSDRERGRIYGFEEWLLPIIIVQLDEARSVSLVRSLHHDYDSQKLQRTVSQFLEAGKRIAEVVRQQMNP